MHFYSENIISTFLVSIFKKGGKNKQFHFDLFRSLCSNVKCSETESNGSTVKLLTQRNLNLFLFTNPDVCFSSTNKFDYGFCQVMRLPLLLLLLPLPFCLSFFPPLSSAPATFILQVSRTLFTVFIQLLPV